MSAANVLGELKKGPLFEVPDHGCQRRCKTRPLGGAKVGHLAPQAGNVGRA
jgi:hypothetical protein